MKQSGLTLIELLIVLAIVFILAIIALPSFQDSRVFADLADTHYRMFAMKGAMQAHLEDWGSVPADYNDSNTHMVAYRARSATSPVCSLTSDGNFATDGGLTFTASRRSFYSNGVHCPLTTPVAYISPAQTIDPFSDGTVPFGYDSREVGGIYTEEQGLAYGAYFSAGPDKNAGEWMRGCEIWSGRSVGCAYSPTNGATSKGELWGVVTLGTYSHDPDAPGCLAEYEFPWQFVFPPARSDMNQDGTTDSRDLFEFMGEWRK